METNKEGMRNQGESSGHNGTRNNGTSDDINEKVDHDVSGNDMHEQGREERRHTQEHGNRTYESNTNHNSANDQPQTSTDIDPDRGRRS